MPKFRVLMTDHPWENTQVEREILTKLDAEIIEAPDASETTLMSLAVDCDALAVCWAKVTERVIRAATKCRHIARMGIGLDNISLTTATELGIPVTNVPDYCVPEVADHALALLLAHARNIAFFHQRTKHLEYNLKAGPPMRRLAGQTLGLIGLGRIGRNLAPKAQALGLKVIAHSPSGNARGIGCEMVSLETLLRTADYVSIHAPLTPASHHLLNDRTLAWMKPTSFVINTSRGGLIDPDALWRAIQSGRLAGAGLDVFEPEPPEIQHPLYQAERVIVTPHAAFVSAESLIELRSRVAQQIADVLQGRRPENVVNPSHPQR